MHFPPFMYPKINFDHTVKQTSLNFEYKKCGLNPTTKTLKLPKIAKTRYRVDQFEFISNELQDLTNRDS